jgi:hypothetical protein
MSISHPKNMFAVISHLNLDSKDTNTQRKIIYNLKRVVEIYLVCLNQV